MSPVETSQGVQTNQLLVISYQKKVVNLKLGLKFLMTFLVKFLSYSVQLAQHEVTTEDSVFEEVEI